VRTRRNPKTGNYVELWCGNCYGPWQERYPERSRFFVCHRCGNLAYECGLCVVRGEERGWGESTTCAACNIHEEMESLSLPESCWPDSGDASSGTGDESPSDFQREGDERGEKDRNAW
jgi:hypothetical protein